MVGSHPSGAEDSLRTHPRKGTGKGTGKRKTSIPHRIEVPVGRAQAAEPVENPRPSQPAMRCEGIDRDPIDWSFDIITARHDEMKGRHDYPTRRSRVVISRTAYPSWATAAEIAACMAVIRHGGMPTDILPRY